MKEKTYFRGKYFDSIDDMIEYSKEWNIQEITQESCKQIFSNLGLEIFINVKAQDLKIKNSDLNRIYDCLLISAMQELENLLKKDS